MRKVVTTSESESEQLKRNQTEEANIASYEDSPIELLAAQSENTENPDLNNIAEDTAAQEAQSSEEIQEEAEDSTESEDLEVPMNQMSEDSGSGASKQVDDHDGHDIPKELLFGHAAQPDSTPQDLSIPGFKDKLVFDDQQVVFEDIQIIPEIPEEDCLPPEGAISFENFKSMFESYANGLLTSGTIIIDTIDQLRQAVECINEINSNNGTPTSYDFTLFLGKNVYNFDGENTGGDDRADIDVRLDTYGYGADYLTILGCGCDETVIDAKGFDRIFDIQGGNVTLSKLLLTGGVAQFDSYLEDDGYPNPNSPPMNYGYGYVGEVIDQYTQGGAVRSFGNLTVDNSCVIGNEADLGGGIYIQSYYYYGDSNHLLVTNSIVDSNTANFNGGGIFSYQSSVDVVDSDVTNNTSGFQGGGIAAIEDSNYIGCYSSITSDLFSTVNVSNSHVDNNTSGLSEYEPEESYIENGGGGIFVMNYNLNVTDGSTVDNNYAQNGSGGGILAVNNSYYDFGYWDYSYEGPIYMDCCEELIGLPIFPIVTVDDSTVNNNKADYNGGGIALNNYDLQVVNGSEVNGNVSLGDGGGIYSDGFVEFCDESGEPVPQFAALDVNSSLVTNDLLGTSITISNSKVNDNSGYDGGGLYSVSNALLSVNQSQVMDNTAQNNGGGIYADSTKTELLNETQVSNNTALGTPPQGKGGTYFGGSGGGLYFVFDQSFIDKYGLDPNVLLVDDAHIDRNDSYNNGAGVYFQMLNYPTPYEDMPFNYIIQNDSTVSFNRAHILEDIDEGHGAGIYQLDGNGLIQESTIEGNTIVSFAHDDAVKQAAVDYLMANWDDFYTTVLAVDRIPEMRSSGNSVDALEGNALGYWDPADIGDIREYLVSHGQADPGLGWQLFSIVDESARDGAGIAIDSSRIELNETLDDVVPLAHLTILDSMILSNVQGESGGGGLAILNGVVDTISGTTFSQNASLAFGWGGALFLSAGSIDMIENSIFSNNYAGSGGGAILTGQSYFVTDQNIKGWIYPQSVVSEIQGTSFLNNFAETRGGAIEIQGVIELIQNTHFDGNRANWSGGGAISLSFSGALYTLDQSSLTNNYAGGWVDKYGPSVESLSEQGGGAIFMREAFTTIGTISNSTLAYNVAVGYGGAIMINGSSIGLLDHVTIAYNDSIGRVLDYTLSPRAFVTNLNGGSGIYQYAGGNTYLFNSIVALNVDNDDTQIASFGFGLFSFGYNIVGGVDGTPSLVATTGDNFGTDASPFDPGLSTVLSLNGSSLGTYTLALLSDSAAIDAAHPLYFLLVDQREFTRPVGDGADIGAFEFGDLAVAPIVFDLSGNGFDLLASDNSGITLMDGGRLYQLGWVGPTDGLLVYDINQDGLMNSLAEIELSRYFEGAQTDLQGLKGAFDSNHDNLFNANDDLFQMFGLFQDKNSNGITDLGEYQTLTQAGIVEIDLSAVDSVSWVNGNKIFGEGVFTMANGDKGMFADVALTKQEVLPESTIQGLDSDSSVTPTLVEHNTVGQEDMVAFMPPLAMQDGLEVHDGSLLI